MSNPSPSLTAIVAATKSNGIGLNGSLPWRLPGEMKYFAKVTTTCTGSEKNTVIMGRKTWESIPERFRPLKDRHNLIISRAGVDLGPFPPPLTSTHSSLTSTHSSLPSALSSIQPESRAFLIGGSQLYNLSLQSTPPLVNRVLLTRVLSDFECDTYLYDFSNGNDGQWARASHEELCKWIGFDVSEENEEKGVRYRYEMWVLK